MTSQSLMMWLLLISCVGAIFSAPTEEPAQCFPQNAECDPLINFGTPNNCCASFQRCVAHSGLDGKVTYRCTSIYIG